MLRNEIYRVVLDTGVIRIVKSCISQRAEHISRMGTGIL